MTKEERQELRHIQGILIASLAKITEMLDIPQAAKPTQPTKSVLSEYDSEAKERFIAP